MITHLCDRCGSPIEKGELRYLARLELIAAADPLEIGAEDLAGDHRAEIDRLLARCAGLTEEELMQDVYVKMEFDLCRSCHQAMLRNPLSAPEGA